MAHHTVHVRSIRGVLAVIAASCVLLSSSAVAQPANTPWDRLTGDARALADSYLRGRGSPSGAEGYRELSVSQRSTFEAIVYALYAQGIFAIIDEVVGIWGDNGTNDGEDQFRVSVKFAEGAVGFLISHGDYNHSRFGHVKLRGGRVVGYRSADSVRHRDGLPSMQISWLEHDFTVGEIDIDYRHRFFEHGHHNAANSDIRATAVRRADGSPGESHFSRFTRRYEIPPEILPWWRSQ